MNEIKVYQMNDYEWVAAANPEDALKIHSERMGYDNVENFKAEYPEDIPRELSAKEMEESTFIEDIENFDFEDDDHDSITFREKLDSMIAAGIAFPSYFATSSELL